MRLKLYRGPAMADAMRQVRAELGAEAMILSSRRVDGGVEVTAGLEVEDEVAPPPVPRPAPAAPHPLHAPRSPFPLPVAGQHADALAFHGASAAVQRKLCSGPLPFALSAAFRFARLPLAPGGRPLLLAGPPGAGKTLSAVRLATRLVMAGVRPMVITADGQRAGATEQLAAFTRLLGIDLLVASQPAGLQRALARRQDGAPVLVDAPGCCILDPAQREALAALAAALDADTALVLPAGMDPGEAADTAAAHAENGASLLVATRLDASRRLGSLLAAAEAGLAIAEAGIGPGAADGMVPFTADLLAQRLLQVPARSALPARELHS